MRRRQEKKKTLLLGFKPGFLSYQVGSAFPKGSSIPGERVVYLYDGKPALNPDSSKFVDECVSDGDEGHWPWSNVQSRKEYRGRFIRFMKTVMLFSVLVPQHLKRRRHEHSPCTSRRGDMLLYPQNLSPAPSQFLWSVLYFLSRVVAQKFPFLGPFLSCDDSLFYFLPHAKKKKKARMKSNNQ